MDSLASGSANRFADSLATPWTGAEIVLPARADALPGTAMLLPAPRATLDLRDPVASLVAGRR